MNYMGIYHSDYARSMAGICDSPCIAKGRMMLCASDTASDQRELAMHYGRIRNRRELSRELDCAENTPGGEMILLAYRRWDEDYPKHVEGPTMSCVMDCGRDKMILCRDRMGDQPVFYCRDQDGRVVFSDHPDSLLKTASAEPIVDGEGLCELFGMGPARTPGKTPLRDVQSLEPGNMLVCCDHHCSIRPYFSIHDEDHSESLSDTIHHTRMLLEMAVDEIAHFCPGVMLSGGLDSTVLTALLSRKMGEVNTFSVDYTGNEQDFVANAYRPEKDDPYVQMAVEALGTRHHRILLEQAQLADALENAVSARGFPGMADVDSSLLLFSRGIRPISRRAVSGECADEVFGGYPWFARLPEMPRDNFPWSGSIALRENILRSEIRERLNLRQYIQETWKDACLRTEIGITADSTEAKLKRMQQICLRFFMPNLQERALRMCEWNAVDIFTPFSDDRLVQYIYNVPWGMKFMDGMEKGLLRAAMNDLIPEPILHRKKSPYPKTCSPIYTEIIRGLIMAMLTDREAPILEWIDADYVRSIAESSLNPADTPWYGQLMAGPQMLAYLWQINTWMRERNVTVSL